MYTDLSWVWQLFNFQIKWTVQFFFGWKIKLMLWLSWVLQLKSTKLVTLKTSGCDSEQPPYFPLFINLCSRENTYVYINKFPIFTIFLLTYSRQIFYVTSEMRFPLQSHFKTDNYYTSLNTPHMSRPLPQVCLRWPPRFRLPVPK